MSEFNNNSGERKALLKHMILQLHEGIAPEDVRKQLVKLLSKIPYNEVVEVEQELIDEGLPETEVLRLCDVHTEALEGHIDLSGMKIVPPGHPVDTFKRENRELEKVVARLKELFENVEELYRTIGSDAFVNRAKELFNNLMDVDKHYRRKENLLFPFLEKYGITGPPKVMWGKHDETRDLLKSALRALDMPGVSSDQMKMKIELNLAPAAKAISDMIMKEEEILFPMTMDKLTETEWHEIYRQTNEIGYCLYDPLVSWKPAGVENVMTTTAKEGNICLPSGQFTSEELISILNTLTIDITFVDRNDKVKYFSQGKERIFDRNRAILGRDVRMCHPPSSVHIVEQIITDFREGRADSAPFWIQMNGKFIHIEYFALRNEKGEYLGTLEMSQDLTELRALSGDQRLLSYRKKSTEHGNEISSQGSNTKKNTNTKITLDARPLLAEGIHPLERVKEECAMLMPGETFEIITPFPPTPMIETMTNVGFEANTEVQADGLYHTFFMKT